MVGESRGAWVRRWRYRLLAAVVVVLSAAVGVTLVAAPGSEPPDPAGTSPTAKSDVTPVTPVTPVIPGTTPGTVPDSTPEAAPETAPAVPALPGGGRKIFGRDRFLVAFYGTAGTGVLGVLGESAPPVATRRLRRAAAPFSRPGERIQPVYELIVTIADPTPGPDGDYNHDIARPLVQRYIDAAERHGALLVLDLQPGRSDFLTVARRWTWALRHPWVGLALDPEWRMGPRQVPGQVIGSVSAREVNRVSRWLDRLTRRHSLPEKVLMLHTFRTSMIRSPGNIADRPHLAEILHVDGFGTPSQKRATYRTVARPRQFAMGFKLFYDEDRPVMRPRQVRRIRPAVRFVSYQ